MLGKLLPLQNIIASHFTVEGREVGADVVQPAGVMRSEPVAVAGRGKLAASVSELISLGRGVQNNFFFYLPCRCQT
jgi:hypothetical protein